MEAFEFLDTENEVARLNPHSSWAAASFNPIVCGIPPCSSPFCTTTTSVDDFKTGGKRASHKCFIFEKGKYPFDQECVLDFDEDPYAYKKADLESNRNIELMGKLNDQTMRLIYDRIYFARSYSRKIKMDIRESLQQIGIKGLRK